MKLSIRWKLILSIGIPLLLVYLGMAGLMLGQLSARSTRQLEDDAVELAVDFAAMVEYRFLAVQRIADAAARTLEVTPDYRVSGIHDWLHEKVGIDPLIQGARVGFAPGAVDQGPDVVVLRAYFGEDDIVQEFGSRPPASPDHELDWYLRPLEAGRGVWTGPFADREAVGDWICSYGVPIVRDGDPLGVVTVDVGLQRIQDLLRFHEVEGGFYAIVSRDGTLVSHPERAAIGAGNIIASAEEEGRDDLAEVGRRIASGETGVEVFRTLFGGEERQWVHFAPIGETGWSFVGVVPEGYVTTFFREQVFIAFGFMLAGLAVILILVWLMATRITRPVARLARAVETLGSGDLDARVHGVETGDEIGALADAFNGMVGDLKKYVEALTRETAARESVEGEIRVARGIQTALLPKTFPDDENLALHAVNVPARRVAGDFFDYFRRNEDTLVFLIADVSGKGVPAALFMAMARTVLRQTSTSAKSVAESMREANAILEKDNPGSMYVTLFVGWYHIPTGTVRYVNAGHPAPYRVDPSGIVSPFGKVTGPPVGMLADRSYAEGTGTLDRGERLVLFTDGVPEAAGPDGEFFGEERFEALLQGWASEPAGYLCERLAATIDGYQEGQRADDVTIVVFERKP